MSYILYPYYWHEHNQWFERQKYEDNQPYVTQEEVNLLIYRLRGRMGECKDRLKVKRGRGCILDC